MVDRRRLVSCDMEMKRLDIDTIISTTASDFASSENAKGVTHILQNALGVLIGASRATMRDHTLW